MSDRQNKIDKFVTNDFNNSLFGYADNMTRKSFDESHQAFGKASGPINKFAPLIFAAGCGYGAYKLKEFIYEKAHIAECRKGFLCPVIHNAPSVSLGAIAGLDLSILAVYGVSKLVNVFKNKL